jgi:hypothetical protein
MVTQLPSTNIFFLVFRFHVGVVGLLIVFGAVMYRIKRKMDDEKIFKWEGIKDVSFFTHSCCVCTQILVRFCSLKCIDVKTRTDTFSAQILPWSPYVQKQQEAFVSLYLI